MKTILRLALCCLPLASFADNRATLASTIAAHFPDNSRGLIKESDLRLVALAVANSSYNAADDGQPVLFGDLNAVATSGDYLDLINRPTLFDGNYASLANKPTLFDGAYNSLTGKPTLFDGAYDSLTGKPTLGTAAAFNVPASGNAASGEVVKGDDTRLSDTRTPTAHNHAESEITNLVGDLAGKVPTTRTVNGHALSANVTVTAADLGLGASDAPSFAGLTLGGSLFPLATTGTPLNYTSAAGGTFFRTNAWAASRGAFGVYDGTASTFVVAVLASSTPQSGYVPGWNSDGTITWRAPGSGVSTNDIGAVAANAAITGATKTKLTYDAKGLVTAGADATTADIADSTNKRYVTDAQSTVLGNTSGTNTGDQNLFASIVISGQTTVTAASNPTALTLVAGGNITLTTDNTAKSVTIAASGGVPTTRTIATTSPLSGGGDLSANRTITIADAAADGTTKGAATFTPADFNATAGLISLDYANGQAASGSVNGFLSSTDWTTFNNKVATTRTISTTSPLSGGGDLSANRTITIADAAADGATKGAASFTAADFNATAGVISLDYTNGQAASGSVKGYLTSADWSTFNNKEPAITAGTSAQYWRGDKTMQTLNANAVGLGNVENTALSTWAGTGNITTVGTLTSGTGGTGWTLGAAATHATDLNNQPTNNGGWNIYRVASSDATTTGQSLVTITGLTSGTLQNSTLYEIEAVLFVTTSTGTNGTEYGVTAGGSGGAAVPNVLVTGTTTTNVGTTVTISAIDTATAAFLTTASINGVILMKGFVTTRGSGTATLSLTHLKVTSGTSTVKIGSIFRVRKARRKTHRRRLRPFILALAA